MKRDKSKQGFKNVTFTLNRKYVPFFPIWSQFFNFVFSFLSTLFKRVTRRKGGKKNEKRVTRSPFFKPKITPKGSVQRNIEPHEKV